VSQHNRTGSMCYSDLVTVVFAARPVNLKMHSAILVVEFVAACAVLVA